MSCRGWNSDAWAAVSLTLGLQALGHHTVLVCREGKGEDVAQRAAEAGVRRIEYLSFDTGFKPHIWEKDLRGFRELWRKDRFNVFHAHRGQEHWLAAAAIRRINRKTDFRPVLIRSRHILEPVRAHLFNRWLYNSATDKTVAATRKILEGYTKTGAFRESRFTALLGGVDTGDFCPGRNGEKLREQLGIPETEITFGMASQFISIKGHMNALEAFAILLNRKIPAHLILAGFGGDQDKVARRAAELEIDHAVHFLGFRKDLPAALSTADVGLYTARSSEGTCRVVLEWMALGKAVTATDVGCVRELLADQKEGLLVPAENPVALADAMERLARSPDLRSRLGAAAREHAEREYGRGVWTEQMVAIYKRALRHQRISGRGLERSPTNVSAPQSESRAL
jgi:glycosyltransferase involved in cell wall biosynthesis